MPIKDHTFKIDPICSCCGQITHTTTGTVITNDTSESLYLARWTPKAPEKGIAILIGFGHPDGFASILFSHTHQSFTVVNPEDYDWQSDDIQILSRESIIGTEHSQHVFDLLDEIWLHDPDIIQRVERIGMTP